VPSFLYAGRLDIEPNRRSTVPAILVLVSTAISATIAYASQNLTATPT
jgi:hypothetical protein